MANLQELMQPMFFDARIVGETLDNYDPADPHRRQDEFDDKHTAPIVGQGLFDTSSTVPIKGSNIGLTYLPDYSDGVLSDYRIKQMLGQPVDIPKIVDLDTAPDYVDFIKNTIRNVIASEGEFSLDSKENLVKDIFAKQ